MGFENDRLSLREVLPPFAPENPAEGGLSPCPEALGRIIDGGGDLVSTVQAIQREYGYLPSDALDQLSRRTGVSLARIYGVVTFYSGFSLIPRGRRVVKVCEGTACHVRGARRVEDALAEALGVAPGHTTEDREFTLEAAACLGCCSLAPVVAVGDVIHAWVDPKAVGALLEEQG